MIKAEIKKGRDGNDWVRATLHPNLTVVTNAMKQVPGAIYSARDNAWAIPCEYRPEFEYLMGDYLIHWEDEGGKSNGGISEDTIPSSPIVAGYSVEYDENRNIIGSTGFKTTPWGEYQVKGINLMVERDFLILADDPGLGKTYQVANAIAMKKQLGQLERGVVVVKSSLLYNWRDEIQMHTNLKAVVVSGTPKQRDKLYNDLRKRDDWTFLIISYETFRIDTPCLGVLDNYKPLHFCIVDEAHKIKNPNSKLGSCIHTLPFIQKYVLTATPLPNSPLESFNYLKWGKVLDLNWWAFQDRYAIMGGYGGQEVVGYKNIKELKALIQNNMLRRRKFEKLKELPDIVTNIVKLKMQPKQERMYKAIKQGIIEDLKDTTLDSVPGALAKLIRLQQVTDTTALVDEDTSKSVSVKFDALDDMLEELIDEGNEKVIIFSRFKEVVLMLEERYKKYNPAMVHGDVKSVGLTPDSAEKNLKKYHGVEKWFAMSSENRQAQIQQLTTSDRQKQVYKFQRDESCKVFLGSTSACREGLTLTRATHVIFIDCEWSPAYVEQAYSRAHRIGQKNAVTVHYLVCEDSIDEHVQATLQNKESMAQVMLDEGVGALGVVRAKQLIASMIGEVV